MKTYFRAEYYIHIYQIYYDIHLQYFYKFVLKVLYYFNEDNDLSEPW